MTIHTDTHDCACWPRQQSVKMKKNVMDTIPTKTIAASGLIGAAVPFVSGALVPAAMSAFGVVTNGVGTIHAAGGIAACLQYVSTCGIIAAGSTVAVPTAAIGILCYNKDAISKKTKQVWKQIQAKL